MDLILWRHAEAQDAASDDQDLSRALTPKGEKQAVRMASWLDRHLPDTARVLASPAVRAQQTVHRLQRKFRTHAELGPQFGPDVLLELVQWPNAKGAVLVVGHQPTLGAVAARLLGLEATEVVIKKGAVWWLRYRARAQGTQMLVVCVQSPDTL